MEELKRCPFCGGEAKVETRFEEWDGRLYGVVYVFCTVCDCRTEGIEYKCLEDAKQKIIKAWNNRKPVEDVLERLEELKMAEYDDSDEEPEFVDIEEMFDEGESSGKFKAYSNAIRIIKGELL